VPTRFAEQAQCSRADLVDQTRVSSSGYSSAILCNACRALDAWRRCRASSTSLRSMTSRLSAKMSSCMVARFKKWVAQSCQISPFDGAVEPAAFAFSGWVRHTRQIRIVNKSPTSDTDPRQSRLSCSRRFAHRATALARARCGLCGRRFLLGSGTRQRLRGWSR